jgi:hypothetical protein
MSMKTEVLNVVGPAWESAWAIWERLDCWSPVTIKTKLNELAKEGKIERRQEPFHGATRWLYRR